MITRLSKSDGVTGPCAMQNGIWKPCHGSEAFCCKHCYGVYYNSEGYNGSDSVCQDCGIELNTEVEE